MENKVNFDLEKCLEDVQDAKIVKEKLINSALFLLCYDLLKDSIVNQVKLFYIIDDSEINLSLQGMKDDYEREVLNLDKNKNIINASVKWLKKMGAINEDDVSILSKYRDVRDKKIGHHLSMTIFDSKYLIKLADIINMRNLIHKVDIWFIKNEQLPIYNSINDKQIDVENCQPISGTILILDLIIKAGLIPEITNEN